MELGNMVEASVRRIIRQATGGADREDKILYEWASGMTLLDAEATRMARGEVQPHSYEQLLHCVYDVLQTSSVCGQIRRMTPAMGLLDGKCVIFLVLPK